MTMCEFFIKCTACKVTQSLFYYGKTITLKVLMIGALVLLCFWIPNSILYRKNIMIMQYKHIVTYDLITSESTTGPKLSIRPKIISKRFAHFRMFSQRPKKTIHQVQSIKLHILPTIYIIYIICVGELTGAKGKRCFCYGALLLMDTDDHPKWGCVATKHRTFISFNPIPNSSPNPVKSDLRLPSPNPAKASGKSCKTMNRPIFFIYYFFKLLKRLRNLDWRKKRHVYGGHRFASFEIKSEFGALRLVESCHAHPR